MRRVSIGYTVQFRREASRLYALLYFFGATPWRRWWRHFLFLDQINRIWRRWWCPRMIGRYYLVILFMLLVFFIGYF